MKKTDIILIVAAVLLFAVGFLVVNNQNAIEVPITLSDNFADVVEISYSDYNQMINENKNFIIVIERDGCTYCEQYQPIIEEVATSEGYPIYTIDIADMESDEYTEFAESNSYLRRNQWGTPTTLILSGSTVIDSISGYVEADTLISTLEENTIVSSNES